MFCTDSIYEVSRSLSGPITSKPVQILTVIFSPLLIAGCLLVWLFAILPHDLYTMAKGGN